MDLFAEVILPLSLPQNYTYQIPSSMQEELVEGMRVVVQLGKRKLYTGLVAKIHSETPEGYHPKEILEIEDDQPIVSSKQMVLWKWIAEYYMCYQGEVMMASLPSGLKLESETVVLRNHLKEINDEEISDFEFLIVQALESQDALSVKEIAEIIDIKNPLKIIQNLLGKHYIVLEEELKTGYKPKQKKYVEINPELQESEISEWFEKLNKAPKQRDLLLSYFAIKGRLGEDKKMGATQLIKESASSSASLKSLEKKSLFRTFYDKDIEEKYSEETYDLKGLNDFQIKAFEEIKHEFKTKDTVLLHGVTSSGKTEIYVQLIDEALKENKQILYLVPEIALTTQLITRLQYYFGEQVLIYHSRFSDRKRVETWLEMVHNPEKPVLVIGARSSLLLPFSNLGLIIVDEEHETSFKQHDPAPRYHARDSAIVLAKIHNTKVLLGSATPSFESYYNAKKGKFGLVEIFKRHGNIPLPEIQCVDLKKARSKKEMHGHFSVALINEIKEVLKNKKQVILFQNRRGFSTMVQCNDCGHVTQCKNCDITLTYHKHIDSLRCHYCGFSRKVPQRCPACNSSEIRALGFGTEKLEDDLQLMLDNAVVRRMDLDSTRKKNAYENIIQEFEDGAIDILVGTQMVTKGLDFENVALVGVMNADTLLNFPDFRSHERAFHLMAQVAGRAGRKGDRGKVLIQTSDPYHQVIRKVMDNDYLNMYLDGIYERKNYSYPPYNRLIKITFKHKDRSHLAQSASLIGKELREIFGGRVLGPEFPLVARLRNLYQMEIILKLEEEVSLKKVKFNLRDKVEIFFKNNPKEKVRVIYDVDPF